MPEKTNNTELEELKNEVKELNKKIEYLNNLNMQVINVANSNYSLIQTIVQRSDTFLKTINVRVYNSLKLVYACITIVIFIIIAIIGSMVFMHFM